MRHAGKIIIGLTVALLLLIVYHRHVMSVQNYELKRQRYEIADLKKQLAEKQMHAEVPSSGMVATELLRTNPPPLH